MAVLFTRSAKKQLQRLNLHTRRLVEVRLATIDPETEPETPHRIKALKGTLRQYHCLRVGDYRVLFEVNIASETATVVSVEHRSKVYRSRVYR